MQEQWKPIKGYEGYYEISTFGEVKSVARTITRRDGYKQRIGEKIIISTPQKQHGCSTIIWKAPLSKNSKMELIDVSRTVLQTFTDDFDIATMYPLFKDDNPANCSLKNLDYVFYMSRPGGNIIVEQKGKKPKKFLNLRMVGRNYKFDHLTVLEKYTSGELKKKKGLKIVFDQPFEYNNKLIKQIQL